MLRISGVLLAALLLAACTAGRTPPPAHLDPSNPEAPPSAPTAATASLAAEPPPVETPVEQAPAATGGHAQHAAASESASSADAGSTLYACPMHPEVTDTKPSRCPKCGMTLVPQKAPSKPASGHEGHEGHDEGGDTP